MKVILRCTVRHPTGKRHEYPKLEIDWPPFFRLPVAGDWIVAPTIDGEENGILDYEVKTVSFDPWSAEVSISVDDLVVERDEAEMETAEWWVAENLKGWTL